MAKEFDIYDDSNGHFHSGPYETKKAAQKQANLLTETAANAAVAEADDPTPAPTFSIREVGGEAIAVETTEIPIEESDES